MRRAGTPVLLLEVINHATSVCAAFRRISDITSARAGGFCAPPSRVEAQAKTRIARSSRGFMRPACGAAPPPSKRAWQHQRNSAQALKPLSAGAAAERRPCDLPRIDVRSGRTVGPPSAAACRKAATLQPPVPAGWDREDEEDVRRGRRQAGQHPARMAPHPALRGAPQ